MPRALTRDVVRAAAEPCVDYHVRAIFRQACRYVPESELRPRFFGKD